MPSTIVSPDNKNKRDESEPKPEPPVTPDEEINVLTCEVTKVITNKDGVVATTITTKETITSPAQSAQIPPLTLRDMSGEDDNAKIIPVFEGEFKAKEVKKYTESDLEADISTFDTSLGQIKDDPLTQAVAKTVTERNIAVLQVKEVEEEETKPIHFVFDGVNCHAGAGELDWTCNSNCNDCYADKCLEYMYGPYCVAAVKRYFEENSYCASLEEAYTVFLCHLNRRLDILSFTNSDHKKVRTTKITNPPLCMRQGSLKHSIHYIKWQIANGPYIVWYSQEKQKKEDKGN